MKMTKMIILILGLAVFLVTALSISASACDKGCTPGYWKQEHHSGNWVGYTPGDEFLEIFVCDPEITSPAVNLVTALEAKGGGVNALTRHAVAALLNAAYWDCFDGGNPQNVIDAYCAARNAGTTSAIRNLKNRFERCNEQTCPLGRAD
jgi:hypothetical protein